MILIFTPIFFKYLYPFLNNYLELNAMNKLKIGFFLTFLSFLLITIIQYSIDVGQNINIIWQLLAYAILTSAEIFISITCLEISYTYAPKKLKSITVSIFLLSISIGNLYTSVLNFYNEKTDGTVILQGGDYFLFFTIMMLIVAILFIPFARKFKNDRVLLQN